MLLNKNKKTTPGKVTSMSRNDFDIAINSLLDKAENLIPQGDVPLLPFMKDCPDVHDWHDFEHQLWNIGEEIRQLTVTVHKELSKEQSNRVCNICLDKKAKRGRQSFVMLLGKKRYCEYATEIAKLLSDDDTDGHAVSTLYKMGTTEYYELIRPFLNSNCTWICNEAKRYIERCNKNDELSEGNL